MINVKKIKKIGNFGNIGKKILLLNFAVIFVMIPFSSAAHYIIGIVNDAKDGTSANDFVITLWNPLIGLTDNLTDIIGPNGNSGADNIYMINCQLLNNRCKKGDILTVKVFDDGSGYLSEEKNVTVGGTGFSLVENITLNSPPSVGTVTVDDFILSPANEIDLLPATTKKIICEAVVTEYDGENGIINANAIFFDNENSSLEEDNDNNEHYTNNSCDINYSYGNSEEVYVNCSLDIWYYANSWDWNCTLNVTDNLTTKGFGSDLSFINPLLALGIDSPVSFGKIDMSYVSDELKLNVTNYGNVKINLSLSGYGFNEGDGNAMNCTMGTTKNISIENEKFNLTDSTTGSLTYAQFIGNYTNLTSYPVTKEFNLDYRINDDLNDANKTTYWRMHIPRGVSGTCEGNIIFGAVQSNEV